MRWCNLFAAIFAFVFLSLNASSHVDTEAFCPKCNKCKACGTDAKPVIVAQNSYSGDARDIESLDEFSSLLDHEVTTVHELPINNYWLKPVHQLYIILVSILSGMLSLLLFPEGRMVLMLLAMSQFCTLIGFYLINLSRR